MGSTFTLTAGLAVLLALPVLGASWILALPNLGPLAIGAMLRRQLQETRAAHSWRIYAIVRPLVGDAGELARTSFYYLAARPEPATLIAEMAFATMAITSTCALVIQALQVGPRVVSAAAILTSARQFWRLGRWLALGSIVRYRHRSDRPLDAVPVPRSRGSGGVSGGA